jgi:predicted ATP-dependent endonuclease of OLD family
MVHIVSFEITGLNGREKPIKCKMNRDTNVLFGLNGSGKTSILRIIDSAMTGATESIEDIDFQSAKIVLQSINYNKEFTLTYKKPNSSNQLMFNDFVQKVSSKKQHHMRNFVSHNSGKNIKRLISKDNEVRLIYDEHVQPARWKIDPRPDELPPFNWNWSHSYLPTSRLYTSDRSRSREVVNLSEETLNKYFATSVQGVWGQKFGEIAKVVSGIQEEGLQKVLAEVLSPRPPAHENKRNPVDTGKQSELDGERAYERMSSFLNRQSHGRLSKALGEKTDFLKRFETDEHIRNIVLHIDEIEFRIDKETQPIRALTNLIDTLFSGGKKVSFDTPAISVITQGGSRIGIERLSSGEKHLIQILLTAMQAEENTLIIDEPELSMHIDWQRDLIKYIHLLNPNCQLICATHSPEVMADIEDEKIFSI